MTNYLLDWYVRIHRADTAANGHTSERGTNGHPSILNQQTLADLRTPALRLCHQRWPNLRRRHHHRQREAVGRSHSQSHKLETQAHFISRPDCYPPYRHIEEGFWFTALLSSSVYNNASRASLSLPSSQRGVSDQGMSPCSCPAGCPAQTSTSCL